MRRHWPNPFLNPFRLVVWVGILVNLAWIAPALIEPGRLLAWLGLPRSVEILWLRAAGGWVLLLTLMYVPATFDPFRYQFNAALLVLGRLGFGLFWFWLILFADAPRGIRTLAYVDTALGVIQGAIYILLLRHEYLRPELPDELPGASLEAGASPAH